MCLEFGVSLVVCFVRKYMRNINIKQLNLRADILTLVCDVQLCICHFPIGILHQMSFGFNNNQMNLLSANYIKCRLFLFLSADFFFGCLLFKKSRFG